MHNDEFFWRVLKFKDFFQEVLRPPFRYSTSCILCLVSISYPGCADFGFGLILKSL